MSEVTCQDLIKQSTQKKGLQQMISTMITIVCCPSQRTKLEKALVGNRMIGRRPWRKTYGMRCNMNTVGRSTKIGNISTLKKEITLLRKGSNYYQTNRRSLIQLTKNIIYDNATISCGRR
ncbi:hypothetical protein OXYTRIMIC_609 [Oxytricha trifallax]|uniref:Uncharacterized protein n=1 Tax=Oxytricha trifallax TaxID=1172189 RepID=A0A073IAI7_9SPIT|nr:hypothetical protein OXYTRIMIC_609 [Oxytricha trifallax]